VILLFAAALAVALAAVLLRWVTSPVAAGTEVDVAASPTSDGKLSWSTSKIRHQTFTDASTYIMVKRPGIKIQSIEFKVKGSARVMANPQVVRMLPGAEFIDTMAGFPPVVADLRSRKLAEPRPATGTPLEIPSGQTSATYIILIGLQTEETGKGYRGPLTIKYSMPGEFRKRRIVSSSSMTACVSVILPPTSVICDPAD
jgi:hypothetical protein